MSNNPTRSLYGESDAGGTGPDIPRDTSLGLMKIITGVFSEPVELFKRLSKSPRWGGALLVMIGITAVFVLVWAMRVDALDFAYMQLEKASARIPADRFEQTAEITAKFLPLIAVGGSLFNVPVMVFFLGLLYWGLGLVSKEDPQWGPTYHHGLVVAAVPSLATLPYMMLGMLMAFLQPVGTSTANQLAPSSLAFWLETDSPKLSALFSSLDLFMLFQYAITFLAAKYALRVKTWGAVFCVVVALLGGCLPVLFAK